MAVRYGPTLIVLGSFAIGVSEPPKDDFGVVCRTDLPTLEAQEPVLHTGGIPSEEAKALIQELR